MLAIVLTAVVIVTPLLILACGERRSVLLNPAFWMFAVVAYSLLAKLFYIGLWRQPTGLAFDRISVLESTPEFLWTGISIIGVGVFVYCFGYAVVKYSHWAEDLPIKRFLVRAPDASKTDTMFVGIALMGLVCIVSFLIFSVIGHHQIIGGPISEKRFLISEIGRERFASLDYYFYKIATLVMPLSCFAAWIIDKPSKTSTWSKVVLFGILLILSSCITMFASLRLLFLVTIVQLSIILVFCRNYKLRQPLLTFVLLIGISQFTVTTFLRTTDNVEQPVLDVPNYYGMHEKVDRPDDGGEGSRFVKRVFEGRYFMDIAKTAHIGNHFSEKHSHLYGVSLMGMRFHPDYPAWDADKLEAVGAQTEQIERRIIPAADLPQTMTISKYLATCVFAEPWSGVTPGFTGSLYIDFGYAGIILGFLLLGFFHRALFNVIMHLSVNGYWHLIALLAFPSLTLLVINSSLLSVLARLILDVVTLFLVLFFGTAAALLLKSSTGGVRRYLVQLRDDALASWRL